MSSRRQALGRTLSQVASVGLLSAGIWAVTRKVTGPERSRTDGYSVQKSETDWQQQLSPVQYQILRQGGTEPPNYSILVNEKRPGTFACAGCGTKLFESAQKFNSGTG